MPLSATLPGRMIEIPLLVSSLITHAARHHGQAEIVSRCSEGHLHRYTYAECEARARRLARGLLQLGMRPSHRVATLAWNGYRHLEIYYAVSGAGAVCHTVNPRLAEDQIAYIINHAEDAYAFFDVAWLALVHSLARRCPSVQAWICMTDPANMPVNDPLGPLCYEELLAAPEDSFEWPELDEHAASSLCYTSGTTGHPKGVLYSHRSTVLHTYGSALPDALGCSALDVICPIVPMFHANAWGLPYTAPMAGAKLVFPGPKLDGASLYELIEREQVTLAAGVPTVWYGVLKYAIEQQLRFSTLKRVLIGGAALPAVMMEQSERLGVRTVHAWGMTEMSPVGTVSTLLAKHNDEPEQHRRQLLLRQGRALYGVDMKIVADDGHELPWDGSTSGHLLVRGHWVVESYFGATDSALEEGWFATGDVATIDADGFLQIRDRSKDVIKSGGEWISSIEIENRAAAHPEVQMAACIACPHSRWGERPLLIIVPRPGSSVVAGELLSFMQGLVPKWWLPDEVLFVEDIPLTATGKVQKVALRERFRAHRLPDDRSGDEV